MNESDLRITESEFFVASLEIKPLVIGHVVLIAKQKKDHFFDLDEKALSDAMVLAKKITRAIQKTVACEKVGMAVLGLQFRQAHLHLVPISAADDLNFTREKLSPDFELLIKTAQMIRLALE